MNQRLAVITLSIMGGFQIYSPCTRNQRQEQYPLRCPLSDASRAGFKYELDERRFDIPFEEWEEPLLPPELYPAIGEKYTFEVDDSLAVFPPFQLAIDHYEKSQFPSSSVFIYGCEDGTIARINISDKIHNTSLSIQHLQNGKLANDRNLVDTEVIKMYNHFSAQYRQFWKQHGLEQKIRDYTPVISVGKTKFLGPDLGNTLK